MKKKGFTLVELLAVIAILAILVIVAMPNVLGRFNQAKKSTFMTEVQSIIKEAGSEFVQKSLTAAGQGVEFDSKTDDKKLDMSGNTKNYGIKTDSQGHITAIIVYDDNFCWSKTGTDIVETDVKEDGIKAANNGNATWTKDGETAEVATCKEE